jgi:hypothetical protein
MTLPRTAADLPSRNTSGGANSNRVIGGTSEMNRRPGRQSPTTDWHFAAPFLITLAFIGFDLQRDGASSGTEDLAFVHDPTRLIVLGLAYISALLLCILRARWIVAVMRSNVLYGGFVLFIGASALWSAYPLKVVIDTGHYVGFTLVVLAAVYGFGSEASEW